MDYFDFSAWLEEKGVKVVTEAEYMLRWREMVTAALNELFASVHNREREQKELRNQMCDWIKKHEGKQ